MKYHTGRCSRLATNRLETPPPPSREVTGAGHRGAGDGLLSRGLSPGVPSALSGLTTVFGMGTGVALTL